MITVPIESTPNQQFTIDLGGSSYQITLKAIADMMYIDIVRDNVAVVSGQRCVSGALIIPYNYLTPTQGNFAFITSPDEMPYYDLFNITQSLVYLTADEINNG